MVSTKQESSTFKFMPEINPEWTRIQRVPGTVTDRSMSFSLLRPIPRALLSSRAYIKYSYKVDRQEGEIDAKADEIINIANEDFRQEGEETMYMKPFMLLANSTESVTLNINGYGMSYRDSKYWSKYIGMTQACMSDYKKIFGASGAPLPTFTGVYGKTYVTQIGFGAADLEINQGIGRQDVHISDAIDIAFENYKPEAPDGNEATFTFTEPLYFGPFNPFFSVKDEVGPWFRRISNTIPYVHNMGLDITLGSLTANTIQFGFSTKRDVGMANTIALLGNGRLISAELVLEWIIPKPTLILQPSISIPTWEVDTRFFSINGGQPLDDIFEVGAPTSVNTDFIHFRQVPSFILIAGVRDKDAKRYQCTAMLSSDNPDGTGTPVFAASRTSWECNLHIDDITITTNVNNKFIENRYTPQEIFNLTSRNCQELPYTFKTFIGGNTKYAAQPNNTFLFLKPDDLNIKQSTGIRRNDFTLQIQANMRTKTGFSVGIGEGNAPVIGNFTYKFMVCTFYTQSFITLNKNRTVEERRVTQFH